MTRQEMSMFNLPELKGVCCRLFSSGLKSDNIIMLSLSSWEVRLDWNIKNAVQEWRHKGNAQVVNFQRRAIQLQYSSRPEVKSSRPPKVEPWAASEEQQATKEQQAAKAAGRQSTAKGEEVRRRRASATSQLDNQFTQNVTIEMYSEWQLLQLFPPTEES